MPGAQLQLFHDPFKTDTVAQHPARGLLHHRAVGHRIGKGNTDLDDVRPALVQFHQSGPEAFFIRETEGHEGDQGMTSGGTGRTDLFFKDMHDELPERPLTTTPVMAVVIWLSAGFSRTTAGHEVVFPLHARGGCIIPARLPCPSVGRRLYSADGASRCPRFPAGSGLCARWPSPCLPGRRG